jgi:hypothetical protein
VEKSIYLLKDEVLKHLGPFESRINSFILICKEERQVKEVKAIMDNFSVFSSIVASHLGMFYLGLFYVSLLIVPSEQIESIIKVSVPENKPSGFVVHRYPTPKSGEVYQLYDSRYTDSLELLKLFQISYTGIVTTTQPLAYGPNGKNTFEIIIVLRKRGETSGGKASTLQVQVTDTNNFVPTFGFRTYNGTIRENSPPNTKVRGIVYCHAEDKDSGGIKGYKIIDGNKKGYFKVNTVVVGGEKFLELKTTNVPIVKTSGNVEKISLIIEAEDNGNPSLKRATKIVITIEPTNKKAPKFEKAQYTANVSEEMQVMSTAAKVHAEDTDTGNGGSMYYILNPLSNYFTVNPITGQIDLIRTLNYKTKNVFDLTVTARDRGVPSKEATTKVTIRIEKDLSYYPPKDSQNPGVNTPPIFPVGTLAATVREDLPVGAFVTLVHATDNDPPGPNRQLVYSLTRDSAGSFNMDPQSGLVTLKGQLDYETGPKTLNLTVTATDKASSPLSASTFLIIYIIDVDENLNPPVFEPSVRALSFPEDTSIGTSVMTVSATDSDSGIDGNLVYSAISGEGIQYLTVDKTTGVMTTTAYVDHEKRTHFELVVAAQDTGNFPRKSLLFLIIKVQPVDDQFPEFSSNWYNASVPDGSPEDTFVTAVHALDKDSPSLTYTIKNPGANDPFKVEAETGVIRTRRVLDKTARDKEFNQMTIEVQSGQRKSQAIVNIMITSSMISVPRFRTSSYQVNIKENLGTIDSLICLAATDSNFGSITYSITTGGSEKFAVEATSGKMNITELCIVA